MRKIRIGKDIRIEWTVLTGGKAVPLEGRDLRLELTDYFGSKRELPIQILDTCTLAATFQGIMQATVGSYTLTLWENFGKAGQTAVDAVDAFQLVRTTAEETACCCAPSANLRAETVQLATACLDAQPGGSAADWGSIPEATAGQKGLMSAEDKAALDGLRATLDGQNLLASTEQDNK